MNIKSFDGIDLATDGGTIFMDFQCEDGKPHSLEIVQDVFPIDSPDASKLNGDILYDHKKITKDAQLRHDLASAINEYLVLDSKLEKSFLKQKEQAELPDNSRVVLDLISQSRKILETAIEKLNKS